MGKRRTTDEFITDAIAIHGDKYDYSQVEYINNKTEVEIICEEHGVFLQKPIGHTTGRGCNLCGIAKTAELNSSTGRDGFIKKARIIHHDCYDYSNVVYLHSKSKIEIICKIHGKFLQTPNVHLDGCGCGGCGAEEKRNKITLTTKEFIKRAVKMHGDRYIYTTSEYINARSSVTISCRTHGNFQQKASHHLSGSGCPRCKQSRGETEVLKLLTGNHINCLQQHSFEGCKDKSPLKFDFYIPSHNIVIEYNGEQHYRPIDFFGGEETFKNSKRRDQIKRDFCLQHNIQMIEIRYDEDLHEKLHSIFNKSHTRR